MSENSLLQSILLVFILATYVTAQNIDLQGRVLDQKGFPIEGAEVSLRIKGISGTTNNNGIFHLTGEAAGLKAFSGSRNHAPVMISRPGESF